MSQAPPPSAYRWVEYDGIGGSPRVKYSDVCPQHVPFIEVTVLYDRKAVELLVDALRESEARAGADAAWAWAHAHRAAGEP